MSEFNIDLQQILSFLVEGNLVPEDVLPKINEPFKCDELINRMEEGSELEYDSINDVLYCVRMMVLKLFVQIFLKDFQKPLSGFVNIYQKCLLILIRVGI